MTMPANLIAVLLFMTGLLLLSALRQGQSSGSAGCVSRAEGTGLIAGVTWPRILSASIAETERVLLPVAALGDVVGESGCNGSRYPWHSNGHDGRVARGMSRLVAYVHVGTPHLSLQHQSYARVSMVTGQGSPNVKVN